MDLTFKAIRYSKSYNYKKNIKLDAWDNNDINNMLDDYILYVGEGELFRAKCQTVANIPGGRFMDTIAPGKVDLEMFVENRNFYGRIHGFLNCYDLEGQFINDKHIEPVKGKDGAPIDFARWLMHDTQKCKPSSPMVLTRVAWSAGCWIFHPSDLVAMNEIYDAYKLVPGDIIHGELIEQP